ncbi:STAS-like domain-containing protein [Bacteroides zoogleoformans]|uniref:STAS-like domain-containing protein n=1 Tax=Bacteroides zoogleoformans TaxID=28119 RepID=UPI00248D4570|nr:DUF4325 domain-containing protein [Bacteroides zoogleoformans]
MEKRISVANLISTDVRSRSNADKIRDEICNAPKNVTLDFNGVVFISRSFTDELYSIMEHFSNVKVKIINTSDVVRNMMNAVKKGRANKRIRLKEKSEVMEFKDMESLSAFLSHW